MHTPTGAERLWMDEQTEQTIEQININTASLRQLRCLPGVSAAEAEAIVAYREQHGGFQSKEDLLQIKTISVEQWEAMYPQITLYSAE